MIANRTDKKYDFSFFIFKWLLLCLLLIFTLGLITKPVRKIWSENYIESGDTYLIQKRYQSANLEYKKALMLFWSNKEAKERLGLTAAAGRNVLELESFYKDKNLSAEIEMQNDVKTLPKDELTAVRKTKELIEKNQYQYAILEAKNAVEMDRNYRDAWLYLGIANLRAFEALEVSGDIQAEYKNEAKTAFEKATNIDPQYKPTLAYLEQLKEAR